MNIKNVFICGHRGMVGSAIHRILSTRSDVIVITAEKDKINLLNQVEVRTFFLDMKIDEVYLAAAKVGGIYANSNSPFDFIYENLVIQTNVIESAYNAGVKKLMFLGSSCIYPLNAKQPMVEECLLTGSLEQTNEPYAIAKIAGIKICESINRQFGSTGGYDYRSVMPTNLYGPGDNYHPENSHVIPGLIQKMHDAKMSNSSHVAIWGSGRPKREFLHVDDAARASVHLMEVESGKYWSVASERVSHINIGSGIDITILELAKLIKKVVGFNGDIILDKSKPDGSNKKLLDSSKAEKLGWKPIKSLRNGLIETYNAFNRQ